MVKRIVYPPMWLVIGLFVIFGLNRFYPLVRFTSVEGQMLGGVVIVLIVDVVIAECANRNATGHSCRGRIVDGVNQRGAIRAVEATCHRRRAIPCNLKLIPLVVGIGLGHCGHVRVAVAGILLNQQLSCVGRQH